jgi:predicted RNA-binding Zn-ribbon protein involved in translation (DUF1610 family)
LNIYRVEFWIRIELDENGELITEPEDDQETISRDIEGGFDLGSPNLANAYIMATQYLNKSVGEDEYEITSVSLRSDVEVMNWPGGDECQCPSCRTERAAEEDKICFRCSCGYEIKIIDDFGEINCPKCNKFITRDKIIGSNGNYILLNLGEGKE